MLPSEPPGSSSERGPRAALVKRVLADGTRTVLARCEDPLQLYVLAGDRLEGPIEARAYPVKSRFVLLNDAALSALGVAIVDPKEGLWCFRDELGRRERRGA